MRDSLQTFSRVARDSGWLWACSLAAHRALPVGVLRLWPARTVPAARLAAQAEAIFRAWGMRAEHIAITVEKMLYADLRGIDSHGCCMLPFYRQLLAEGRLNPDPAIATIREDGATALIDGGGGLGHVTATLAMEKAIELSRTHGTGAVAVRNSGHYGAAGAYAAMAAAHGLLGLATTTTPTPAVVPTFARVPLLGTNPIAIAVPGARHRPFLLDMATSTVSRGRLVERWRSGRRVPRGWAVNRRGRPTTSARAAGRDRLLAPLGGTPEAASYKGYGLAVAVEILSALLPGVPLRAAGAARRAHVGHFLLAIDPARFRERAGFLDDVDALIDTLHGAERADAVRPVLVAGDPEQAHLEQRSRAGIPLARTVFEDLRALAIDARVPFVLEGASP